MVVKLIKKYETLMTVSRHKGGWKCCPRRRTTI